MQSESLGINGGLIRGRDLLQVDEIIVERLRG